MQAVILGWRVYEILQDPLALGFIGLTEAIPAIGLALYAGYIVDRSAPLVVYRRVLFVSLLSGLLVLAEHVTHSTLTQFWQVALLYSGAFLTGLARAFWGPSVYAVVPRMVQRHELLSASARMSSVMQVARIAGPAAGGLIFGFAGAVAASTVVCVCLLLAFFYIYQIRTYFAPLTNHPPEKSMKEELLSGVRFVFSHPILLPALSLDMISVLFGGVTALLPIFAKEILLIGPKGLGALRAAPAVGAALMSFYLAKNPEHFRSGRVLLVSVAGFGLCILLFGFSTNAYLSFAALLVSGVFDSISMVIRSAAVQLTSPDHMRGRVSAVNSIFIGSSNEIGEFESGIAAKLLGPVPAVYLGGLVCLLTVGSVAWLSPSLRRMDLRKI